MVASPMSPRQRVCPQTTLAPLSTMRTETVLSRFPMHHRTTREWVTLPIRRPTAHGARACRWAVSDNEHDGPARQLASTRDTIVLHQRRDTVPRPLPSVRTVRSMSHVGGMRSVETSGRQQTARHHACHHHARASLVASHRSHSRDGTERTVQTGCTRSSVLCPGERLPDGTTAAGISRRLNDESRDILPHAPVRPLASASLTVLTPTAQRFSARLSDTSFAALQDCHPHAPLRYADSGVLATQQRDTDAVHVQQHMDTVHRPQRQSGSLTQVQSDATTDAEGLPDGLLHATPGPTARAAYAACMRQPGADAAAALVPPVAADQKDRVAPGDREAVVRTVPRPEGPPGTTCPASPQDGAQATPPGDPLLAQVTPSPKELAQATQLLATPGEMKARALLALSHAAAQATDDHPQTCGGILPSLARALAAYDAQATQATTHRTATDKRTCQERSLQWRQQELMRVRKALPPAEYAAMEDAIRARLVAEGTPVCALGLAVRMAVDEALEARVGLPAFAVWRQTPALSHEHNPYDRADVGADRHAS